MDSRDPVNLDTRNSQTLKFNKNSSELSLTIKLSKEITNSFDSAIPCHVIGPENSRHFLHQSDPKLTPIATRSPAFSRALGSSFVYTLSLFRLAVGLTLGFAFTTLHRNALYCHLIHKKGNEHFLELPGQRGQFYNTAYL